MDFQDVYSPRRKSIGVNVDGIIIGSTSPIVIQSMTNTDTANVSDTTDQIIQLALAGSELVRITVNDHNAATAVPYIREALDKKNCSVPLVGDFHFNGLL